MNTFIIKLLLMPLVVALVTLASRKWGNNVAGILASLPFVAGPILLFIAIERGVQFASNTIPGVMVGVLGWNLFCIVYIIVGQRYNAFVSTLAGYIAYIGLGLLLQPLIPLLNLHVSFIIDVILILLSIYFFPKVNTPQKPVQRKLKFEIPLRMIVITIFVVGITYFADILGSTWSGILTPFPIITTVLVIFTHYTQGIEQVRKVLLGLFTGFLGFTTFLYLQADLLLSTTIFNAFLCGIVVDILITIVVKRILIKMQIG
jgi:hypothetical protein